jgi:single-stranded-DNA-specific exonuclease
MASINLLDPHTAVTQASGADQLPVAARLDLRAYDLAAALRLEQELGISHVLSQILVRRGYAEPQAARGFLAADERHEPNLFDGIDHALELIWKQVRAAGRIVVHGDYDVDGVCATAVLVRALRALGADVGWYLPSRSEDGYGLSAGTVERLAQSGTGLLVTVDCGITAVEQVQAARTAGLDVVITDHHAPRSDGELPDCPIVHPALCRYPTSELCGTAVAHKLAEALGAPTADADLELVALATVADLMPLRGENRRLVREGLIQMAGTDRVGMRALMRVSRTDPSALDATCLAFRLAPRINAAGRMRRADAGLELLLTDDAQRAEEIARELDAVNAERRATEQRITWEADAIAKEMGERSAYVLAAPGWHAGVIGIVASKIVERHNRPTIMLALDAGDPAAPAHGSGRSIPGFDLLGALEASGEHLMTFGGHRAAAGLSILPEQIPAFRDAFELHAERLLTPELLSPVERVDAVVSGADMSLDLADDLARLAPFGNGNPEVKLYVTGATFDAVRKMGEAGQHVRFNVNSGGVRANAVAFGCEGRIAGADGKPIDATFTLERNVWNGVVEPRLILQHGVPCSPPRVHVLGEPDDYLTSALMEFDRELEHPDDLAASEAELLSELEPACEKVVVDLRGWSPLAAIADAQAAARDDRQILVICADTPRRLAALAGRRGGFALISHESLLEEPELAADYMHIVVLDPPTSKTQEAVSRLGSGYTHLAWGEAELRFAQQIHELEYGLRASLVTLYRAPASWRRTARPARKVVRAHGAGAHGARADQPRPGSAGPGDRRRPADRAGAFRGVRGLHQTA